MVGKRSGSAGTAAAAENGYAKKETSFAKV
jgi:hypothetical protein